MANKATIRKAKYDQTHSKPYYFKFHLVNDADIIAKLDTVESRQGYIKQLIRQDIARNGSAPVSVPDTVSAPTLDELYSFLEQHTDVYDGTMYGLLNALVGKHMGYTPDE